MSESLKVRTAQSAELRRMGVNLKWHICNIFDLLVETLKWILKFGTSSSSRSYLIKVASHSANL